MRRHIASTHRLEDIATAFLVQLQPDAAISGLALGWDTAFAQATLRLGIPLTCAIPVDPVTQTSRWRADDASVHAHIRRQADRVVEIAPLGWSFAAACLSRNEWMADEANVICAMWDGGETRSGTGQCVNYAERIGRPVVNLWGLQL